MVEYHYDPALQEQLPDCRCRLDGRCLGGESCSAAGMAMLVDWATLGAKRPGFCGFRDAIIPRDTVGGLTLPQVANTAVRLYGLSIEQRVGSNVCTPTYAASRLRRERAFGLQGNTSALVGSPYRSTGTGVNHFVAVIRGDNWSQNANGYWIPDRALVFDSCADGRTAFWGKADQGPTWWPWEYVLRFAAALEPRGEGTGRLGRGAFYAGFVRPEFRKGHATSKPATTYPDRTRAIEDGVRVHSTPAKGSGNVVDKLADGELFVAYQYATVPSQAYQGDPVWAGSRDGRHWVHRRRLTHVNGAT